ncbi:hypothetical protein G7085_11110 [Tessaracoccus sp. HDW20]|nr:hypothetical protein [Tessaracoccus coleopterorum]
MSILISALEGGREHRLPVWFMRQAGRSLPEYKTARGETSILEACLRPEMAAEITLQPVRRHKVDAAIFFSDIMTPLVLAGWASTSSPGWAPSSSTRCAPPPMSTGSWATSSATCR